MVTRPETDKDKEMIIVDDVITTGVTLNEFTRVLMESGTKRIFAVTLAVVIDWWD